MDERHTGHIRGVCKAPAGFLENTGVTWSWSGGSQRCRSQLCQMHKFCFCRLLPGLCCSRHTGGEQPHGGFVERQGLCETSKSHGRGTSVGNDPCKNTSFCRNTTLFLTHLNALGRRRRRRRWQRCPQCHPVPSVPKPQLGSPCSSEHRGVRDMGT